MNLLVRLLLLIVLLSFPQTGRAQETGTGILCDTQEQLEQLVAATVETHSLNLALQKINDAAKNPQACGLGSVAFVRGKTVKTINTPEGLRDIVEITVIGGNTPQGFKPVPPQVQYTLFKSKGQAI